MRLLLAAAAVFLATAPGASAQASSALEVGQRVRVVALDGSKRIGTLVLLTRDSLGVRSAASLPWHMFALEEIDRVDVRLRGERRFLRAVGLGVGLGAGFGVLLGAATYEPCVPRPGVWFDCIASPQSRGEAALMGGVALGALGLVIGVVTGLVMQYDVWGPPGAPSGGGVGMAPERGGAVRLGVRIPLR